MSESELDRLGGELGAAEMFLWLALHAAGGSVRITPEAIRDFDLNGAALEVSTDFDTQSIVVRAVRR